MLLPQCKANLVLALILNNNRILFVLKETYGPEPGLQMRSLILHRSFEMAEAATPAACDLDPWNKGAAGRGDEVPFPCSRLLGIFA